MAQRPRPLSPFMHYRWQYTNTLSILHRLTGIVLSAGFLLFVYWLVAAASGVQSYAAALECLGSLPARIVIVGAIASFCFHLLNGVRHLFFDAGVGFELATARTSGRVVAIGSIVLTLLVCVALWSRLGGMS